MNTSIKSTMPGPASAVSIGRTSNYSALRSRLLSIPFRMMGLAAVWVALCVHSAAAAEVTLDDHGTGPCWWGDPNRADWVTMPLKVVTGNVWQHDDTNPWYPLVLTYGGTEPLGQFHVPYGAPAGTVVFDFTYQHNYPLCAVPPSNTHVFGFPNGVWVSGTGVRRGDATGDGLVITYTHTGDGGPTGSGLAVHKTSPAQVWVIYDGPASTPTPAPTPGANTRSCDKKFRWRPASLRELRRRPERRR